MTHSPRSMPCSVFRDTPGLGGHRLLLQLEHVPARLHVVTDFLPPLERVAQYQRLHRRVVLVRKPPAAVAARCAGRVLPPRHPAAGTQALRRRHGLALRAVPETGLPRPRTRPG